MKLEFDVGNVSLTEFGVGRDNDNARTFVAVPVDGAVQTALRDMVQATWDAMTKGGESPTRYEPSEKHASSEYLYLPLEDNLAGVVRVLHTSSQLVIDTAALSEPGNIFCYFARLTDLNGRRLTALRRATQFKGILRSKNRLVRMLDDTLRIVEDAVFKLDSEFDLLVDAATVHILHPSGFEFACQLQEAILSAVPDNIEAIQKELMFVDFAPVEAYALTRPRAARYLASIRGHEATGSIDKTLLNTLCSQTGVQISDSMGTITVADGHEMGFLEVLDRRRYEISLVTAQPERYRAASRSRLKD